MPHSDPNARQTYNREHRAVCPGRWSLRHDSQMPSRRGPQ